MLCFSHDSDSSGEEQGGVTGGDMAAAGQARGADASGGAQGRAPMC